MPSLIVDLLRLAFRLVSSELIWSIMSGARCTSDGTMSQVRSLSVSEAMLEATPVGLITTVTPGTVTLVETSNVS